MRIRFINIVLIPAVLVFFSACKSQKEKLTEQIKANEDKLFNDSTKMLDSKVAVEEMGLYEKYVSSYADDTASAGYLFKAADLAHGIRRPHDAVRLYKDFVKRYPSDAKTPASSFLIAFVYDTDLGQKDSAKIFYKEFLEKYPTHQLAPSAKASLDQIEMGLTDEQLVKMFEARIDSAKEKK